MLTKVKLRQKPLADGKLSLYLDFYPPIADPVTGKKTRREFLQLHIWEKPKGSLQRQHNADTLFVYTEKPSEHGYMTQESKSTSASPASSKTTPPQPIEQPTSTSPTGSYNF